MKLYLDIETIPDQKEGAMERIKSTLQAPSNYKDADKIAQYIEETAKDKYLKTALDGTFGQIVCIAWAVEDKPVKWAIGIEKEIINCLFSEFYNFSGYWEVIGHNILGFDLKFIRQRCFVNNINISQFSESFFTKRYNDACVFDTMQAWAGYGNFVSLKNICYALNIETDPEDISGSQVYDYWKAGNMDAVVRHCVNDVETVRKVAKRMGV